MPYDISGIFVSRELQTVVYKTSYLDNGGKRTSLNGRLVNRTVQGLPIFTMIGKGPVYHSRLLSIELLCSTMTEMGPV